MPVIILPDGQAEVVNTCRQELRATCSGTEAKLPIGDSGLDDGDVG